LEFFAAFFAAFFAVFFAVFFAIFDILVCLAIRCVPQSKSPSLSDVASSMSRGDEIKLDPNSRFTCRYPDAVPKDKSGSRRQSV
jgi:hypothetical protein